MFFIIFCFFVFVFVLFLFFCFSVFCFLFGYACSNYLFKQLFQQRA